MSLLQASSLVIYSIGYYFLIETMEKQTATLIIAALIIGMIIGTQTPGLLSQDQADDIDTNSTIIEEVPDEDIFPPENGVIDIGYIVSTTASLETCVPFFKQIIEPDINEYVKSLGQNFTFNFVIKSGDGHREIHLEKVKELKSQGINVFLGGLYSSQAQAALDYVNENDMLMVSPSSTSPLLAIPDDRLYRICPTDYDLVNPLVEMFDAWGSEAIIVVQRGDSWADGIYDDFEDGWLDRGKVIIERIRYSAEVTEFSTVLAELDGLIAENAEEYGYERISVLTLMFSELVVLVSQTPDYPDTRKVVWMRVDSGGCGGGGMLDDTYGLWKDLGLFAAYGNPISEGPIWESLDARFTELVDQPAGYFTGTKYDAAWLIALSIIQTGSTEAGVIARALPEVAGSYYGATGSCELDENGDRMSSSYHIPGPFDRDGVYGYQNYGRFDGETGIMTWFDDVLAEQGYNRPG